MITNTEPELPKNKEPIKILVAKALSPDSGKQNQKTKKTKVSNYNILGDLEDYQEFNKLYNKEETESEEEETVPIPEEPVRQIAPEIKETQDRETQERKEWLEKLHVFQRYREIREEHALKNWERHCSDWSKMEQHISLKSGKKPEDLLMSRLCEYRQVVEEKRLIEEALRVLEDQKIDFWKEGIKIGNDLLGLSFQLPSGGPRQLDKKPTSPNYHDIKKKELGQVMKVIDPFYRHTGEYVEAVGQNLSKLEMSLTKAFLERLDKAARWDLIDISEKTLNSSIEDVVPAVEPENALKPGMHLEISSKRLFFEVELNRISTSILTVHNRGTYSVHFEWAPVKRDNPLKVLSSLFKTIHAHSGNQTFFFSYIKGVILPGTAFDFPIVFKSSRNGVFTEMWKLTTSPTSKESQEIIVTLKGVAYEKDFLVKKRNDIEKLLHKRCAETVGKETVKLLMQRVQSAQMRPHKPFKNTVAIRFEDLNKHLNLKYNLETYQSILALKDKVYGMLGVKSAWGGSVSQLYEYIVNIENEDQRTLCICELNELVNESCYDDSSIRSELRVVICNEILMSLALRVVDISEEMRKQTGLPLTRQSNVFFSPEDPQEELETFELTKTTVDTQKKPGGPPGKAGAAPPAAVGKDQKKGAAPPAAKADPKKPGQKKPNEAEQEEAAPAPKVTKKKPLSSKGWSPERRLQEQTYSANLHSTVLDSDIDETHSRRFSG
ncbi:hypothetical protein HDV01_006202 [Terramyces sp. JEL0728]|nr:hypothetical protein HDV01_006202 [Terramyces sp. JEL0728]